MANSKERVLFKNTIFLYILTFSNYFFAFITTPLQTRVLGTSNYGKLGVATAFVAYFQVIIEFGFILSATEHVAKNRNDKKKLSQIMSSVMIVKVVMSLACFLIVLALCGFVPKFKEDVLLYILCFFSVALYALMPDFLYRGLEEMKIITFRSVIIRVFFTIMIFIFLREPTDYYLIPVLNCVGSIGAIIVVYLHVYRVLKIRFIKVPFAEIINTFKYSAQFFLSRAAGTIYSATNTFLLGMVYPTGSTVTGLFTAADRLVSTSKSCFTPISDSIYPYMVAHKDFKMIRKVLAIFMPIIILGCIVVGIFAEWICAVFFGEAFREAGTILRILLVVVVITLPTYVLGFPTLTPMGLAKHANYSVIMAAVLQLIMLFGLLFFDKFNVYTLSVATVFSEASVLIYRLVVILKNKNVFMQAT